MNNSVMSNFNHAIDESIAKILKIQKCIAQFSAWNFCGYVWFEKNKWHCEVWIYHNPQKIISDKTLKGLMDKVCEEFGYD